MKTLYILVHVPVVPYAYPFNKIGHYHKYYSSKLQQKVVEEVFEQLNEFLNKNSSFQGYDKTQLLLTRHFTTLCPNVFSIVDSSTILNVAWEYRVAKQEGKQEEQLASIVDIPQIFNDADFTTLQSIIAHQENFEKKRMDSFRKIVTNHLQLDALKQQAALKEKYGKDVSMESNFCWFMQAEHLQWMSHEKENQLFPSPFSNAYDAYINYMNMLSDLKTQF